MSATMDPSVFVDYYYGVSVIPFEIPGRAFMVEEFFLQDVLEMMEVSCYHCDPFLSVSLRTLSCAIRSNNSKKNRKGNQESRNGATRNGEPSGRKSVNWGMADQRPWIVSERRS